MALEEYRYYMETCRRCSPCKFIPLEKVVSYDRINVCPSISRYEFHSYSGGGRLVMGTALLEKHVDYTDKLLEVVYNCTMCGACDTSCKYSMDIEVMEPLEEIRFNCVEKGRTNPALDKVIENLRQTGAMVPGNPARRGDWARDLGLKDCTAEKVDVVFHAGSLTCFNKNLWPAARTFVKILRNAGVDFGIAGVAETSSGGRAYQMGYRDDFLAQARKNMDQLKKCGARTLITGDADAYQAFKVLYDQYDLKGDLEVLHVTEYLDRLISTGKLKPKKPVDLVVTYHDPCHLGRKGEPYIHWTGKEIIDEIRYLDPPKEYRRGTYGVYEPPRNVLKSIPGLRLVEMDRIKEYAWCCGAGGGVIESNPEFSLWTAGERIEEAALTGASAIVTTCPWCIRNFKGAITRNGSRLEVYDVLDLLAKAL